MISCPRHLISQLDIDEVWMLNIGLVTLTKTKSQWLCRNNLPDFISQFWEVEINQDCKVYQYHRLCNKCLTTVWQLCDNCVTTVWQLSDNCLTTFRQLSDNKKKASKQHYFQWKDDFAQSWRQQTRQQIYGLMRLPVAVWSIKSQTSIQYSTFNLVIIKLADTDIRFDKIAYLVIGGKLWDILERFDIFSW